MGLDSGVLSQLVVGGRVVVGAGGKVVGVVFGGIERVGEKEGGYGKKGGKGGEIEVDFGVHVLGLCAVVAVRLC